MDYVTLRPGSFAVFFPQDAHMPKLGRGAGTTVRKIVVKVPVAEEGGKISSCPAPADLLHL